MFQMEKAVANGNPAGTVNEYEKPNVAWRTGGYLGYWQGRVQNVRRCHLVFFWFSFRL